MTTAPQPNGDEFYGTIRRIEADGFIIAEIDQKHEITLRYDEVKKIRKNYGSGRAINGKRIRPHTKLIFACGVIGGLLLLTFIAVASDHS